MLQEKSKIVQSTSPQIRNDKYFISSQSIYELEDFRNNALYLIGNIRKVKEKLKIDSLAEFHDIVNQTLKWFSIQITKSLKGLIFIEKNQQPRSKNSLNPKQPSISNTFFLPYLYSNVLTYSKKEFISIYYLNRKLCSCFSFR